MLYPKRLLQHHDPLLSNLAHFRTLTECHLAIKMGAAREWLMERTKDFPKAHHLDSRKANVMVDLKVRQKVCHLDSRKAKAMADLKEYLMVPLTALKKVNSKVHPMEYH